MSIKNLFIVTVLVVSFQQLTAQRNFDEYNRLGINGGLTLFDINTSNLTTKQGQGFSAGLTTRGSFRNSFDLVYGINFTQSNIEILGSNLTDNQYIEYSILAAQINFLGSFNIVEHHLSIEFGPVLNVNGKMKLKDDAFNDYILDGYNTVRAQDIEDISSFNFRLMGGLTAGLKSFRLMAHYQYGLTNMLNNLNDKDISEIEDIKGNSSTIILGAVFYF
ncbi:outer membrane beta-barrel protein [Marixanthomonas spongiae]|uniref:Uncharacterized protein n=1 Tax=Marixanthomonas spongiae TaxID=2174845 RepID=A0A2U0I227_9FLAO|nr:outer membrane beta-barrel protein [Marixanthomonas spongiae]PVW15162.1 hypothetical protein DDV96_07070 [Marixanthomonas spongiae]